MIDIRDLTIGNWVFDGNHTKFPMQITSLSEGYVTMSFPSNEGMDWESKPEDLMGIPLTDELLEKCGLRSVGSMWEHPDYSFEMDYDFEKDVYIPSYNWVEYYIGHPIKFLHELQNLFWNITKKQLKIKL